MVANPFISTHISTAPVGATTAGFGVPMLLSYNAAAPFGADRGRLYGGYDEVIVDFPVATGPEALWAAAVFGQSERPPLVAITRGDLPPTQRYVIGANAVTPGAVYRLTAKGKGVTSTDIAITLPLTNVVVASAAIANATDTWTSAAHGMTTGDGPYRVTTSDTLPVGLAVDTDYWVIATGVAPSGTFKLASSYANAIATTAINITSDGIGNQTLNRTANDVLMALLKDRLNSVVGKNFTAAQTAGALDTDTLTITADAAGYWFSLAVADLRLLSNAQTHADPGVATDLAAVLAAGTGWYVLDTVYNSKAYVEGCAAWIEANGSAQRRLQYNANTCDSLALTQTVGTGGNDTMDRIKTLAYARTFVWYHPEPSAMLAGRFEGRVLPLDPGKVTAHAKPLNGIAAVELTSAWYANIIAKNGNSYASFETGTAATFIGKSGSGEWWDVVRNDDAVNDRIRVNLYNVDYQNNIVPFDDGGITLKEAALSEALSWASQPDRRIYSDIVINAPLASAVSAANHTARRLPIPWSANRVGAVVYTDASGTVS